jgi:hypothetical protein
MKIWNWCRLPADQKLRDYTEGEVKLGVQTLLVAGSV